MTRPRHRAGCDRCRGGGKTPGCGRTVLDLRTVMHGLTSARGGLRGRWDRSLAYARSGSLAAPGPLTRWVRCHAGLRLKPGCAMTCRGSGERTPQESDFPRQPSPRTPLPHPLGFGTVSGRGLLSLRLQGEVGPRRHRQTRSGAGVPFPSPFLGPGLVASHMGSCGCTSPPPFRSRGRGPAPHAHSHGSRSALTRADPVGLANPARSFACLAMAPMLWGPSAVPSCRAHSRGTPARLRRQAGRPGAYGDSITRCA